MPDLFRGMVWFVKFCDKSIPAHLKAAARVGIPTVFCRAAVCGRPDMTTSLAAGKLSLRMKSDERVEAWEVRDYKHRLSFCRRLFLYGNSLHHAVYGGGAGNGFAGKRTGSGHDDGYLKVWKKSRPGSDGACQKGNYPVQIMTPAAFKNALVVHSAIGGLDQCHASSAVNSERTGTDAPYELVR